MTTCYATRSLKSRGFADLFATPGGLAQSCRFPITLLMFDPDAFLAAVLAKAGSKAAMARALDTPTSRVAELFRDEGQRKRRLSMKEGMTLAEAFEVAPFETVNVEKLKTVLRVCRRHMPKGEWSDQALERLAREIEFGLSLLRSASDDQPSQEALDVASRAIADRFRDKPA